MEASCRVMVGVLCLALSFVLAACASDQANEQQSGNYVPGKPQLTMHLLPRKLKPHDEAVVESSADKDIMLQRKLLEASADNKEVEKEEDVVIKHARKRGTWREWVESPNKSEYFTMDYAWVRRRRPIHNKQFAP